MIALILFLLMGPPPVVYGSSVTVNAEREAEELAERCAGLPEVEWRKCQPRVINLGSFDARPAPGDWSYNNFPSAPPDFGTYPTEKPE